MNVPYLSIPEYRSAPTGINLSKLDSSNPNQASQDAELTNIILRASAWIDNIVGLPKGFAASTITETVSTKINKNNYIRIIPKNVPLNNLVSLGYKLSPNSTWNDIDASTVQLYPRYFELMMFPYLGQFLFNNLNVANFNQFSSMNMTVNNPYLLTADIIVKYTYVSGFAHAQLTQAATAGSTTLRIDNILGVVDGTRMRIYNQDKSETVTILGTPTTNTVTLTSPLLFDHPTGEIITAIPPDIKEACILLVNYFLKERGVNSVSMATTAGGQPTTKKLSVNYDLDMAKEILSKYGRPY